MGSMLVFQAYFPIVFPRVSPLPSSLSNLGATSGGPELGRVIWAHLLRGTAEPSPVPPLGDILTPMPGKYCGEACGKHRGKLTVESLAPRESDGNDMWTLICRVRF